MKGNIVITYSIYVDTQGLWHWYAITEDSREIARSGEPYRLTKDACIEDINLIKTSANAEIIEVSMLTPRS